MSEIAPDPRSDAKHERQRRRDARHRRRAELLAAIAQFRQTTGLNWVPYAEVLRIAKAMGWRKVSPADDIQAEDTRENPSV